MTVTKKGMMVMISTHTDTIIEEQVMRYKRKPHVERVRTAMRMQIEEMSKHPNWLKYLSQNGNKDK